MEPAPLEIQSPGLAVERLGRARTLAWLLVAVTLPTLLFTAGPILSITRAAAGWVVMAFWSSFAGLLGGIARLLALRYDPALSASWTLRKPGLVTVREDAVTLVRYGGNHRYPLAEIAEGWLEPASGTFSAALRMRSGDLVSIEVQGADQGEKLLRAVGVAPDQQVWKTRLANASTTIFGGGCLAAAASVVLAGVLCVAPVALLQGVPLVLDGSLSWVDLWQPAVWLAGDLLGFFLLLRALTPPLLIVGSDGVALRGFARRRRFVPYTDVRAVERRLRSVVLVRTSGQEVALATGEPNIALGAAVHDRITLAMASRRAADEAGTAEALDRGGRSPAAWREHLRTLDRGPEGYRIRSVPPERLASVLEDVASPPERRVAAALALSRIADPTLRKRVQAAVSSCADEELRATLEAAAADEIAEEDLAALTLRR